MSEAAAASTDAVTEVHAAAEPSGNLAMLGNAIGQAARPAVLLLASVGYGAETVGRLSVALSLVVLGSVAFYPPLGQAVLRHRAVISLRRGLLIWMAVALASGSILTAGLLVADTATLMWIPNALGSPIWSALVLVLVALTVAEQYALGLCSAAGVLDQYSIAMLFSRGTLIAGAIMLALARADPIYILLWMAATSVLLLILASRAVPRMIQGPAPSGLVGDGLAAAPTNWAWFLVAQASVLVVQATMGSRAAGHFTIAYLLLNLPLLLFQGIALAWMARAARRGPVPEWARTRRLVLQLVAGHIAFVALLATVGSWAWAALFGHGMDEAFSLLQSMAWGAPGFAMAYLLAPQWTARGWFLRLSIGFLALSVGYIVALAALARGGQVWQIGWATAGLGMCLAILHFGAVIQWNREQRVAAKPAAGRFV